MQAQKNDLQEWKKCCNFASRSASQSQRMTLASLGDGCLRSPQKLKIFGDPIKLEYEKKYNYIITPIDCMCSMYKQDDY